MSSGRIRPAGASRAFAALGLALTVATCRDALGPRRTTLGRVAVAPVFPSEAALSQFGLTIDAVRFIVVRPVADTIADTTLALPPDATELELDLRVPLIAAAETLSVSVVALSGTVPLFAGTSLVPVPSPLPPTVIPLTSYVGPVADSIVIQPRDPFILVDDSLRFQVLGFNAGVAVTQFYVAWSTSDTSVAGINGFGVLRAPASRASVRVRARTPSGASDSVTATFTLPATQLVLVAGGAQVDTVGDTLVTPLEVQARAADGIGVGGVAVRFRPLAGGGTVVDSLVVTDSAGRARTTAKLGGAIGFQTFEASATGLTGSPVTFSATAVAGPVAQVLAAAGDGQLATVNTAVATAPRVQVKDGGGNPVAGAIVTFAVTSGGGGVTGGTDTTDASGFAAVGSWTLDTLAGPNTLRATVAGLTRTFTATGVAGTAAQLVATAGDLQSAVVGTAVGIDPTVRAEDQFGNPVAGRSITFVVSGGGGSVTGGSQLTNAAGVATAASWTLDTIAGTNALTAATDTISVVFTATGAPAAPSRLVKVLGDSQAALVNTAVTLAPTVRLSDRYGNPIAGDTIDFAVFTDGGFVANPTSVTGTGGLASAGAWTLATFVTENALQAAVRGAPVPLVHFTARGTPDAPVQLLRESVDTQTAIAGQAVSVPPAVRVVDQFFNAVPGVSVTFTLTGVLIGTVTPTSATTDSSGVAPVTTWTLATTPGLNTLDADVPGLLGSPVSFSANGITTTATSMVLGAGDGQAGIVATLLPTAYSVVVKDGAGLPVPNVQVHWAAVGPAGGSMNPATSATDVNGIAASTRTLGTVAGNQTATASVGGLTGSPVTFSATALPDTATQLLKQSADPQTAIVATPVAAPPVVMVADPFGNGVAGVIVTFLVTAGGGSPGASQDTTDALGLATAGGWTLGTTAGTNMLQASAPGLPVVTFSATGVAGAPARLAFLTEPARALAGNTIDPVQVVVQDQFGNTVLPAKDVVTLGLGAIPNPAAKLLGTVGVAAVNGVATFAGLSIDSAGIGYTLVATAGNLAGAEGQPFDVGGVIAAFRGDLLQPVAAAFNSVNGLVYVPGGSVSPTLGVLDPSKELLSQLPILQGEPFGVAVNATTNRVYVTTSMLLVGAVTVIDGRDNALVTTIPIEGEPRGIAIDEATDRIFVAVAGDPGKGVPPSLAVIDGTDNRVVISIPFKDGALDGVGVAFNPNDRLVYVAIPNLGVGIFEPEGGVHVTTVPIVSERGAGTHGVAVDVRSNLVYATNRTDGTVSVLDPTKLEEIRRLPVGLLPEGLGVDADRGVVYVGNSGDGTVSFIDTGKLSVIATLVVGPQPKAAAVDPATGRVYVPTFEDDRVRVIQP